jgi:hypothetical protein
MQDRLILNPDELLSSILQKATTKREGSYEDATEDVMNVVTRLINSCPELDKVKAAKIKYLMKTGSWSKLGECAKTSGKWRHLTEFDFVVVLHKESWTVLSNHQREALIHHELGHVGFCDDKWVIVKHDVEEFLTTFKRYGAWSANLQVMRDIVAAPQNEGGMELPGGEGACNR